MSITNTWAVTQMDCYPEYEGEPDVVFTVHWTLSGTDGTHMGSVYGSAGLTLTEGATFSPYDELTLKQVIGWVHDALGEEAVASCEANVAQQIAAQANPPVVTPPLPWATS